MGENNLKRPASVPSRLLIAAVLLGLSCSKPPDEAQVRAQEEPTTKPAAPSPPQTASIASLDADGLLNECDEFTITYSQGTANKDVQASLVESVVGGFLKKNIRASRLTRPCSDEFRANTVLASCVTRVSSELTKSDSDAELAIYELQMTSRYYNLEMLAGSDAYMKACTERKGDWQALDKNSDEYKAAVQSRIRFELDKAKKAAKGDQ
jgi:hypothetical protein